jgi:hypothetical protein
VAKAALIGQADAGVLASRLGFSGFSGQDLVVGFSGQTDGTGTLAKQELLRIEREFTLSSIRNDFFVGPSLL